MEINIELSNEAVKALEAVTESGSSVSNVAKEILEQILLGESKPTQSHEPSTLNLENLLIADSMMGPLITKEGMEKLSTDLRPIWQFGQQICRQVYVDPPTTLDQLFKVISTAFNIAYIQGLFYASRFGVPREVYRLLRFSEIGEE